MRSGFVVLVSLVSLGLALSALAGSVRDTDLDLVPDAFDNCIVDANGPNQSPNDQIDGDQDGFGNACDSD